MTTTDLMLQEYCTAIYELCRCTSLPFDPRVWARALGVPVLSLQRYSSLSGDCRTPFAYDAFTLPYEENPVIVYNRRCAPGRLRFSLTHELCHIALGHAGVAPTQIGRAHV